MLTIAILMTIFASIVFFLVIVMSIIMNLIDGCQFNFGAWFIFILLLPIQIFIIVGTWLLYNRIP